MRNKFSFCQKLVKTFYAGLLFLAVTLVFGQTSVLAGYIYALNDDIAGSRIYGFQVNETTGALTPLNGFPVFPGSGGNGSIVSERMIADRANRRLYVINDGADTVSAYSVNPSTGALTEMPFSPIALGAGTWNTIAVHPSGSPLIVSNGATGGAALSFNITATTATAAAGSPFPLAPATAFSSVISPDGNYFYAGGNTGTIFAGFSINASTGVLTPLPGSPFDSGASNPLAYAMDTSNRFFTVNSNNDLRAFTTANGIPSPVAGNPFASGLSQRRFGIVHPSQNFYMVAGNSGNNVGVYHISGSGASTTLTAVAGSPFPTGGTTANNLAFNRTGTFLYVGNRLSRNLTTFSVNTTTGVLGNRQVQPNNTLGTTGAINGIAYVPDASLPLRVRADFDGDGKTDFSVFRPDNGTWFTQQSTAGFNAVPWGNSSDKIVPGDYDGDGRTDYAVFRKSADSTWYILQSLNNQVRAVQWGAPVILQPILFDFPVPADYDGDGKTDLAVWRLTDNLSEPAKFSILQSSNGQHRFEQWGSFGDTPAPADYDGDEKVDLAVYRSGAWYIKQSTNNELRVVSFGTGGDKPVPADYDGDGKADIAVFRPSNGVWYRLNSSDNSFVAIAFGLADDKLVPGDYDGDGKTDFGVYRNGIWYLLQSAAGFQSFQFGLASDVPVPNGYLP